MTEELQRDTAPETAPAPELDVERLQQELEGDPTLQAILTEVRRAAGMRLLAEQLDAIHRLDPAVSTAEDLVAMPAFEEFDRLVRGGLDLVSAYKLANFDALAEGRSRAAAQAALNDARGLAHLSAAHGGGEPREPFTEEELRVWQGMGFTPEKARAYHARFKKE